MPLAIRPTFSESWYRVANLKCRLRPSAQVSRQYYRGDRWYVVRDPAGNTYHRLSDTAYRFVALLDGSRTIQEAWDLCGGQLADDAPTQPEVIQILSQLYSANLVMADVTPDSQVLFRRDQQMKKKQLQSRLMQTLFPKIPIWDPDRFLKMWMPVMRPLLGWIGVLLWLGVVGTALAMVAPQHERLTAAAGNVLAPGNWLYLWAVFIITKLIHELGHAFACRRFGGECHEMGVMFLVLIPTPYVDASSAWAFPSKWARIFVGAGGMIFEIFFAALCAFVWLNTNPNDLLSQLAYNAMIIASVSTVLFNANPLLRYDGYYMLSDFLEIANMQQKGREYVLGLIQRHIFRIRKTTPLPSPGARFWLFTYNITSSVYRLFIGLTIMIVVLYQLPPQFKILGVFMAASAAIMWLVVPVVKLGKYLLTDAELHRKRGRATLFCVTVAAAVLLLIGAIPFSVHYRVQGIVEPVQRLSIASASDGVVLEVFVTDQQRVKRGDPILRLTNPDTVAQHEKLVALRDAAEIEARGWEVSSPAQSQAARAQVDRLNTEIALLQRRLTDLVIVSPGDGVVHSPSLHLMRGRFVNRGAEVGNLFVDGPLVVRGVVEQADISQLTDAQKDKPLTEVRLAGDVGRSIVADRFRMDPAAINQLPQPSLSQAAGGTIATDPRDQHGTRTKSTQAPFEAYLPAGTQARTGQVAYVRIEMVYKQTIAEQATRRVYQMLMTYSGQSEN